MSRWSLALAILAVAVLGAAVLVLRELREEPPLPTTAAGKAETAPLTDVAGPARRAWRPPVTEGLAPPVAAATAEAPAVPPSLMPDPSHPPQGTAPLATPGAPTPPDPARPPALAQDPERGGRTR